MATKLYNANTHQGKILSAILRAKELAFDSITEPCPHAQEFLDEPTIIDNNHVIHGGLIASLFIEQRYPHPNMLPLDPEKSSIVMMIFRNILEGDKPLNFATFKSHLQTHGFVTSDRPSFADVAITALAPKTNYWLNFQKKLSTSWNTPINDELKRNHGT